MESSRAQWPDVVPRITPGRFWLLFVGVMFLILALETAFWRLGVPPKFATAIGISLLPLIFAGRLRHLDMAPHLLLLILAPSLLGLLFTLAPNLQVPALEYLGAALALPGAVLSTICMGKQKPFSSNLGAGPPNTYEVPVCQETDFP